MKAGKIIIENWKLGSNITSVNALRSVLRPLAKFKKIDEINEIELQYNNGVKIKYGSIQTKRGLGGKTITFEELFERGGKIMY